MPVNRFDSPIESICIAKDDTGWLVGQLFGEGLHLGGEFLVRVVKGGIPGSGLPDMSAGTPAEEANQADVAELAGAGLAAMEVDAAFGRQQIGDREQGDKEAELGIGP